MMDKLELFSFELDERIFEDEKIYYLNLPPSWQGFLDNKKTGKNRYQLSIRPSKLGKKLQALFPSIVIVSWKSNTFWLVSDQKINTTILKDICLYWFANEENCLVNELPENMVEESLEWNVTSMKAFQADFPYLKYNWIPALMARRFASMPQVVSIKDGFEGNLELRHVYFNGIHECVSKPIKRTEQLGAFSYVFQFKYKTRGLQPERGILNVSIGTRRYLQQPIRSVYDISQQNKGSILLAIKNTFYKNAEIQPFIQLKFERRGRQLKWAAGEDSLFLDVLGETLELKQILEDPLIFMEAPNPKALVVYSDLVFTSQYNLSKVGGGIGLPEKWALFDYFKEVFSDLKPLALCKKVNIKRSRLLGKQLFPLKHYYNEDQTIQIEIWNKGNIKEEVLSALKDNQVIFDCEEEDIYLLNSEPRIKLQFSNKDSRNIVHALETDKYKDKAESYHIRKIEKYLSIQEPTEKIILSLIEIDVKNTWDKGTDPKQAIRIGFAKNGRITQFIYPKEATESSSKRASRILNSIYDLLTDIGFLPAKVNNFDWKRPIISLGLINAGYGRFLPVMTKFNQGQLRVKLFGQIDWELLQETLVQSTSISKSKLIRNTSENRSRLHSFFKRGINEILEQTNDNILILFDAPIRNWWKDVRNGDLKLDKVPIKLDNLENMERVRVVRINQTDEIPQYRINPKGEVKVNQYKGLFKDSAGIYYSVGSRPDNMMSTAIAEQKYYSPRKQFLHQRLVELIPLGTEDVQEREELAVIVEQLREFIIAYNFHTVYPYPLHMLRSIRKYMNLSGSGYYDSEFDERIIENEDSQLEYNFNHQPNF